MQNKNWFDEVMKLRPQFDKLIKKYEDQVINIRYEDPYNEELSDKLIVLEDIIIRQILDVFGKYQNCIQIFYDPWEIYQDYWRCGELRKFEQRSSDYFWYSILGELCFAFADGRI